MRPNAPECARPSGLPGPGSLVLGCLLVRPGPAAGAGARRARARHHLGHRRAAADRDQRAVRRDRASAAARPRHRRRGQRRPRALGAVPADRPRAFIQSPEQLRGLPRFADWRQINAQALVSGTVEGGEADGNLAVEFRLWDVFAGVQMRGLRFATTTDNWRRVAHQIADAVYERITGEGGYFDTRIVYISESGPATDRVKRVAIMDQDGANHRFLTDGADLVLTPRFRPDAKRIAFMTYRGRVPQVYELDLASGRQQKLGDFTGMTFAPRFSPDGRLVVMSLAEHGNSDIYSLNLETHEQRRLTSHPAIDTSPSFAPDGRRLVFNSDRAGTPQLYVMNRRRQRRAADQLRRRPLRQPGLVAARRSDRLHQDSGRPVPHRRDAPGRQRRAPADPEHAGRGPDLVAQWPGDPVLARGLPEPTTRACSAST